MDENNSLIPASRRSDDDGAGEWVSFEDAFASNSDPPLYRSECTNRFEQQMRRSYDSNRDTSVEYKVDPFRGDDTGRADAPGSQDPPSSPPARKASDAASPRGVRDLKARLQAPFQPPLYLKKDRNPLPQSRFAQLLCFAPSTGKAEDTIDEKRTPSNGNDPKGHGADSGARKVDDLDNSSSPRHRLSFLARSARRLKEKDEASSSSPRRSSSTRSSLAKSTIGGSCSKTAETALRSYLDYEDDDAYSAATPWQRLNCFAPKPDDSLVPEMDWFLARKDSTDDQPSSGFMHTVFFDSPVIPKE